MKGLVWGSALVVVFLLLAVFTGNWQRSINLCSLAGVGSLIMAMVLSGSLQSGAGMRAMFAQEKKTDRDGRHDRVTRLAMFALPNIIAALSIYSIIR